MEFFVVWFIFAIVIGVGASQRGRSGLAWFFIAMLISPLLALILLALMPNLAKMQATVVLTAPDGTTPTPETHVKCPDCAEFVRKEAKKCRYCGAALSPEA